MEVVKGNFELSEVIASSLKKGRKFAKSPWRWEQDGSQFRILPHQNQVSELAIRLNETVADSNAYQDRINKLAKELQSKRANNSSLRMPLPLPFQKHSCQFLNGRGDRRSKMFTIGPSTVWIPRQVIAGNDIYLKKSDIRDRTMSLPHPTVTLISDTRVLHAIRVCHCDRRPGWGSCPKIPETKGSLAGLSCTVAIEGGGVGIQHAIERLHIV